MALFAECGIQIDAPMYGAVLGLITDSFLSNMTFR